MKFTSTLLFLFFLFVIQAGAQNITGIWKGYFAQNSFGFYEDRYRFEVQIAQMPNNALTSVTYSYKTTVFYGKAEATGIFTPKTNNVVLNELKMVDLKIDEKSQPCLMTCYLEYAKIGNMETLTGTYASRNTRDGKDCGSGKVYLERSTVTDFYKEDFLVKREAELKKEDGKKKTGKPSTNRQSTAKTSPKKPAIKPGAEEHLLRESDRKELLAPAVPQPEEEQPKAPPVAKHIPKPDILNKRKAELVKTITTSANNFTIELYDNGDIDGDRISVYHNNELVVSNKTLTDKAIKLSIDASNEEPVHEFVLVAENLGSIPPNTALMVIKAGGKRYELFVTSTEQKNAVVRIEYKQEGKHEDLKK